MTVLPLLTALSAGGIGGFIGYRLGMRKGKTLCLQSRAAMSPVAYQYVPVPQPVVQATTIPAPIPAQTFVQPPITRTVAPAVVPQQNYAMPQAAGTTVVNNSGFNPTLQPKRVRRPHILSGNKETLVSVETAPIQKVKEYDVLMREMVIE